MDTQCVAMDITWTWHGARAISGVPDSARTRQRLTSPSTHKAPTLPSTTSCTPLTGVLRDAGAWSNTPLNPHWTYCHHCRGPDRSTGAEGSAGKDPGPYLGLVFCTRTGLEGVLVIPTAMTTSCSRAQGSTEYLQWGEGRAWVSGGC
jgi:hypothetical protein